MGKIEKQWQTSLSRRKALAGMAGLHRRLAAAARAARSASVLHAQTHARAQRDAHRVRLRAGDVRQRPAGGLRLHGARRWRRMESAAQPSGVRLGRSDSRQGGRSVDRRSVVAAARPEAEVSDHHRADGDAGGAASRRRGRDVSRGATVVEHADVPQQQLEPVGRAGCEGREGTAVVAVLSAAGSGREPRAARARARRGLYRDGRHRRSAGVVSTSGASTIAISAAVARRPRRWTRGRGGCGARVVQAARTIRGTRNGDDRPRRSGAWLGWCGDRPAARPAVGRPRIASARAGSGTAGSTSTRSGSSSRRPCSSRAS